jgi:hypothetical protein
VEPDIVVELPKELDDELDDGFEIESQEDTQLKKSIEVLREEM